MYCSLLDPADPPNLPALEAVARACSPRIERDGGRALVFDVRGLDRAIGPPAAIAVEIDRLARAQGLAPRLAIAETRMAASLLAQGRLRAADAQGASASEDHMVVIPPGQEAAAVALLKLELIECRIPSPDLLAVLHRWGLRMLGDLARLPEADVRTRLGEIGARWHRAARGLDEAPLVPEGDPVRFVERLELEWPVEGLEPLSFVLARLCEVLSKSLERADRGAVAVTTRLRLVTRASHARTLHLPAPMRDARVLRTLILLDLESHPPPAAIDIVDLELDVAPGRIVQGSLVARSLPSPESLATLVARLGALMGESRVGAPRLVDTHDERVVGMKRLAPAEQGRSEERGHASARSTLPPSALCLLPSIRRFRLPIAVAVELDHGVPVKIRAASRDISGGAIVARAGPWRSSGHWWSAGWDRDLWDVELADGVYRLARDRTTGRWEIEGVLD